MSTDSEATSPQPPTLAKAIVPAASLIVPAAVSHGSFGVHTPEATTVAPERARPDAP